MTVLDHCAVKNLPRTLFVLLLSCAVCLSSLVHATEKEAIGEVLFAVGDRWKQDATGSHTIKPKRGTALYAGDVLSTADTGFLQLKMIDGGFISLRSNSRLRINSYEYNPENPEENKVNLSLEEGVVRSVTGKAGESNRKRFRLNTPIAAIGVRGTDFTVYTDVNQSQVAVARGGIVISPFSDSCRMSGEGPCEGNKALELFAQHEAYIELRRGLHIPVIREGALEYLKPTADEMENLVRSKSLSKHQVAKDVQVVALVQPGRLANALNDSGSENKEAMVQDDAEGLKESSETVIESVSAIDSSVASLQDPVAQGAVYSEEDQDLVVEPVASLDNTENTMVENTEIVVDQEKNTGSGVPVAGGGVQPEVDVDHESKEETSAQSVSVSEDDLHISVANDQQELEASDSTGGKHDNSDNAVDSNNIATVETDRLPEVSADEPVEAADVSADASVADSPAEVSVTDSSVVSSSTDGSSVDSSLSDGSVDVPVTDESVNETGAGQSAGASVSEHLEETPADTVVDSSVESEDKEGGNYVGAESPNDEITEIVEVVDNSIIESSEPTTIESDDSDPLSEKKPVFRQYGASSGVKWGRWSDHTKLSGNIDALTYGHSGYSEHSKNSYFVLFRQNGENREYPDSDTFNFNLSAFESVYVTSDKIEQATLRDGSLSLDFGKSTFSTSFKVHSDSLRGYHFEDQGIIDSSGNIRSEDIKGFVNEGVNDAGFLFERQVMPDGRIYGATYWDR